MGSNRLPSPRLMLAALIAASAVYESAASAESRDLLADTWVAVDGLSRQLPGHAEAGGPFEKKTVGVFYFLWLGAHSTGGPFDVTRITSHADDDSRWGPPHAFHHWGQPEVGYYRSDDPWVARRHASQLVNAGVDVVFIDMTNGYTYDDQLRVLAETWLQMRQEGNPTPQFALLCNTGQRSVVDHALATIYRPGRFRELWFHWDGKPLLLADANAVGEDARELFTIRRSWAWRAAWYGDGRGNWPWIDNSPQAPGLSRDGQLEQIPVAVAGHPIHNLGRSGRSRPQPVGATRQSAHGLYFQEQWDRALKLSPPLVFVTGWNEWVAQRFIHDPSSPTVRRMAGQRLRAGDSYFIDQYNQEFSRDIEPMTGGHGDAYYYQLASNTRRFKGVRRIDVAAPRSSITIDGAFDDWADVKPLYFDAVGDNAHRGHPGFGSAGPYVDQSGRNDLVECRVAADDAAVYFLATCHDDIQVAEDSGWMRLVIDVDGDLGGPDREGFELVIAPDNAGVSGKQLEVRVARERIGDATEIAFQWCDHFGLGNGEVSPPMLLSGGDVAPDGRFMYQALLPQPNPIDGDTD